MAVKLETALEAHRTVLERLYGGFVGNDRQCPACDVRGCGTPAPHASTCTGVALLHAVAEPDAPRLPPCKRCGGYGVSALPGHDSVWDELEGIAKKLVAIAHVMALLAALPENERVEFTVELDDDGSPLATMCHFRDGKVLYGVNADAGDVATFERLCVGALTDASSTITKEKVQ